MKQKRISSGLYTVLVLTVIRGAVCNIYAIVHSTGISLSIVSFVFAAVFLLSVIFIPILSVHTGRDRGIILILLSYWSLLAVTYVFGDISGIRWLENAGELLIFPYYSLFPVLWELSDGETATVLSILSAYYVIPFFMIVYLSVMLSVWNRKRRMFAE